MLGMVGNFRKRQQVAAPGLLTVLSLSDEGHYGHLCLLPTCPGGEMGAGTCSRRHLSMAHSTSQAALSLAYCCCSRSRAHSSSRSSERRSSSKVFRALNSCWFSTACGDTGVGCHLTEGCSSGQERREAWQSGWCWAVSKVPLEMGAEPGGPHAGHRAPGAETAKGWLE